MIDAPTSPFPLDRLASLAPSALDALRTRKILFDGHFAGDFSLAIVNRAIASALIELGADLSIYSADPKIGWDPAFAQRSDLVSRRLTDYPAPGVFDLHMRNMWPPQTSDMLGASNVYVCFAWEELEFPQYVVDAFNGALDAVLTASTFVSEALLHSGVTTQVHTVGLGCDHVAAAPPRPRDRFRPARVLHVSSGLPRKGIDVLAEAFAREFRAGEPVELYVKTSPWVGNGAERAVAEAAERRPDAAPMLIDERPLDEAAMSALYRSADMLVGPSRGEGFGLPFAEAMRAGLPVATTGHGGCLDFCTPETAFLIDATLSPSGSHLAGLQSVWAEPDAASLARTMRAVLDEPERAAAKVAAGQALLASHFTWASVAKRIAIALHAPAPAGSEASREIDLVLSADPSDETSRYALALCRTPQLAPLIRATITGRESIASLCEAIAAGDGGTLWVHQDPRAFGADAMKAIAGAAGRSGHRRRALSLYDLSTIGPDCTWLAAFDVVFTASPDACAAASRAGARNPVVLPKAVRTRHRNGASTRTRSQDVFRLVAFGLPLSDQAAETILQATAIAAKALPGLRLDVLCGSESESAALIRRGWGLRIDARLTVETAPTEENALIDRLAAGDLVALPCGPRHRELEPSVRAALAADRPLCCAADAVLRNAPRYAHTPCSASALDLADVIGSLARDPETLHALDASRRQVAGWFDVDRIAGRFRHHLEDARHGG